ncbi:MAG: heavy metal translocating P-type ATPase [Paracoccaceae bacterium]
MPLDLPESQENTLRFQVDGLSCAGCVGRSQKAMAAIKGVSQAGVNLATGQATVTYSSPATAELIRSATEKAGYPAQMQDIPLIISGATCASCVLRIETALNGVPGVANSAMNLATGRAQVNVYSGSANRADLVRALESIGYSVEDVADTARPKDRHADAAAAVWSSMIVAAILTLPVFVVEMGGHIFPAIHNLVANTIGMQTSHVLQFILTTIILAGPGRSFFTKGIAALIQRAPDMNSLVALGAFSAWAYSTITTFAPTLLPVASRNVYFESAAVIVTLILLGRYLEARAKGRTGDAIKGLLALAPDTASVERGGDITILPLDAVRAGDIIHIKPGERLGVDGTVLTGQSYIDESMITGEAMPVEKTMGDAVTGGTINGTGALSYAATAVGRDTMLARIVTMVEDAQGAKLPIQGLVDRITAWFVPAVLVLALLTVASWLIFGPDPALSFALVAGVAVLIIACPCAMGLATPTSIMVGTGRAAELGVLFRRGDALQTLQEVSVVALDKTGTLTAGHPELTDMILAKGYSRAKVLPVLAAVESQSEHPIAKAITKAATQKSMKLPKVSDFKSLTGNGVRAMVGKRMVLIGADRLMAAEGIDLGDLAGVGAALAKFGKTPLYAAIDGVAVAAIAVSDPIKPTSKAAIDALHKMGLKVAMLTGDNAATARAIADQLGIDHVVAEVLPKGKTDAINSLRETHGKIGFVGDGINDAPALAAADVGIAVGTGTDIAIEAADIVLMSGDLRGVLNAFDISRRTMTNIRQNLFWAFGYNIVLIPVAAGALYPVLGTLLSPALAAGAMAMSSVFVVTNALRLRFIKPVMEASL